MCDRFEPQAWRKQTCVHCFHPRTAHVAEAIAAGEAAELPVVATPPPRPRGSWSRNRQSSPASNRTMDSPSPPEPLPQQVQPLPPDVDNNPIIIAVPGLELPEPQTQPEDDHEADAVPSPPPLPQSPPPLPQSPQPIPAPPGPAEEQDRVDRVTGAVDDRTAIMQMIRQGVRLRQVIPTERTPATAAAGPVSDLSSELHWRLSRKRREDVANKTVTDDNNMELVRQLLQQLRNVVTGTQILSPDELRRVMEGLDQCYDHFGDRVEFLYNTDFSSERTQLRSLFMPIDGLEMTLDRCTRMTEIQRQHLVTNKHHLIDAYGLEEHLSLLLRQLNELDAPAMQTLFDRYRLILPDSLVARVTDVAVLIMNLLITKAFSLSEALNAPGHRDHKRDIISRASQAYDRLYSCNERTKELQACRLHIPPDARIPRVNETAEQILAEYKIEIAIRRREGTWDQQESVTLGRPDEVSPISDMDVPGNNMAQVIIAALDSSTDRVAELLRQDDQGRSSFFAGANRNQQLKVIHEAVQRRNLPLLGLIMQCCATEMSHVSSSASRATVDPPLLLEVFFEIVRQGYLDGLKMAAPLCIEYGVDLNTQTRDGGNTILHIAARRSDVLMVTELLRIGVDPLLLNNRGLSALVLLAIKEFVPAERSMSLPVIDIDLNFDRFLRSTDFSDVSLYGDDRVHVPAHKIILCAQSSVFDAMLRGSFVEATKQEIYLADMNVRLIGYLLEFLYTGRCLYPRDDLSVGIDMLRISEQFLLVGLKRQVENHLMRAVDLDNVVPLTQAIRGCEAKDLQTKCLYLLLTNFDELTMTNEDVLITLIESLEDSTSIVRSKANNNRLKSN